MRIFLVAAAAVACMGAAPPPEPTDGVARVWPHDDGVVDLMVTGPAAKQLYDRLPGKGRKSQCGDVGLLKGDGRIACAKRGEAHVCHVWLDVPKQALAPPQEDDC
jgi:hypothetical protein